MFQFGLPWRASRKMFLLRRSPFARFLTATTSMWSCHARMGTTIASSKWRGPGTRQSPSWLLARTAKRSAKPNSVVTKAPSAGTPDFHGRRIFIAVRELPGPSSNRRARKRSRDKGSKHPEGVHPILTLRTHLTPPAIRGKCIGNRESDIAVNFSGKQKNPLPR